MAKALRPAATKNSPTAPPESRPTGVALFDAGIQMRPVPTLTGRWDWLRRMLLVHALQTKSAEEDNQPSSSEKKACKLAGSEVEPTGFEPVTSCLQSRRSPN